ncbi:MAG: hypothetical protein ACLUKN_02535 [Bacilli bacterium]
MPSLADISRYKIAYALADCARHTDACRRVRFAPLSTENNTYKDSAANALDYERGGRFLGLCNWMRNFVKFRKSAEAALRPEHPVSDGFLNFCGRHVFRRRRAFQRRRIYFVPCVFAAFNPSENFAEILGGEDSGELSI